MSSIEMYLNQLNPAFQLTPFLQDPFKVFVYAFKFGMFIDGPVYRTTILICIVQTLRQIDNRFHVLPAMWQHWALLANTTARVLCDFPAILQSRMGCGHCRKPRDEPSCRAFLPENISYDVTFHCQSICYLFKCPHLVLYYSNQYELSEKRPDKHDIWMWNVSLCYLLSVCLTISPASEACYFCVRYKSICFFIYNMTLWVTEDLKAAYNEMTDE